MAQIIKEEKNCRSCDTALPPAFLNLGNTPLANSYVKNPGDAENYYPLATTYCVKCHLVQLTHTVSPEEIFLDYAYFSSYSSSFLEHAEKFSKEIRRLRGFDRVLELASNDGYLLQYFKPYVKQVLGVEPAKNIAKVAIDKGIPTIDDFFGMNLVNRVLKHLGDADLIIGNNVLAHVPDINDFVHATASCLSALGWATFEFPYLPMLVNKLEFDTIYHEHFFYYSVITLNNLFKRHGLEIFDIKFSEIHGGSIRIFVAHKDRFPINSVVSFYEMTERLQGVDTQDYYDDFAQQVQLIKTELKALLNDLKWRGKTIAAYGAPAKGNTLLNYCGIGQEYLSYTVDISPHKYGLYLPGTQIPIYPREKLLANNPDYTLLLPWNFTEEILSQQEEYLKQGGQFIVPVPKPRIVR